MNQSVVFVAQVSQRGWLYKNYQKGFFYTSFFKKRLKSITDNLYLLLFNNDTIFILELSLLDFFIDFDIMPICLFEVFLSDSFLVCWIFLINIHLYSFINLHFFKHCNDSTFIYDLEYSFSRVIYKFVFFLIKRNLGLPSFSLSNMSLLILISFC